MFTSKNYVSFASVSPFKMIKHINLIDNTNLSVSDIEHYPVNPIKPADFDYTRITITANVTGADLEYYYYQLLPHFSALFLFQWLR